MLDRLLIIIVILAAGFMAYRLLTRYQLRRAAQDSNSDPLLQGLQRDMPTIVYFTTPQCMPCITVQKPALQRLREQLNDKLQVIQIDATQDPEAAKRWRVLSVPTTFVLDKNLRPHSVNNGATNEQVLMRQIEGAFAADKRPTAPILKQTS